MGNFKVKILWIIFIFLIIPYCATSILSGDEMVPLQNRENESIEISINDVKQAVDLQEYMLGVLANEIPMDYELEAMKAQAVIIHTRLSKDMQEGKDITYAYLNNEQILQKWESKNIALIINNLEIAILETAGMVMQYEGALIVAPYHYSNNGVTVGGEEGFGLSDFAYLQPVECGLDRMIEESDENHGMGLSQNTANYMALEGKKFEEILYYFYTDIEIVNID